MVKIVDISRDFYHYAQIMIFICTHTYQLKALPFLVSSLLSPDANILILPPAEDIIHIFYFITDKRGAASPSTKIAFS